MDFPWGSEPAYNCFKVEICTWIKVKHYPKLSRNKKRITPKTPEFYNGPQCPNDKNWKVNWTYLG